MEYPRPGSSEAAEPTPVGKTTWKGVYHEMVHLNKVGASERILWNAVKKAIEVGLPNCVSVSATKFEDSKTRLLLASSVMHYLVYSLLLSDLGSVMKTGSEGYDTASTPEKPCEADYRQAAHRGESMRCFDYDDFNSQHTLMLMLLLDLSWIANAGKDLRQYGPNVAELGEVIEWLGISRLRQTVRWQDGIQSAVLSGLVSGLRATDETNTPLNVAYERAVTKTFQPFNLAAATTFQSHSVASGYRNLQTSFQNVHRIGSLRYRNQATFVSHGLTFAEAYERTGRTGTVGWVGLRSGGFSRVGDS